MNKNYYLYYQSSINGQIENEQIQAEINYQMGRYVEGCGFAGELETYLKQAGYERKITGLSIGFVSGKAVEIHVQGDQDLGPFSSQAASWLEHPFADTMENFLTIYQKDGELLQEPGEPLFQSFVCFDSGQITVSEDLMLTEEDLKPLETDAAMER